MEAIEPGTMNIEELTKRLGIARGVAYRIARERELPVRVFRVGRRVFVSRAAVEAMLSDTRLLSDDVVSTAAPIGPRADRGLYG